jgi:hypothetical protein
MSSFYVYLVVGLPSSGKEQPISEPVLTPNGWSTMGQLRPGDYVIGSSGLPIKVLSIHPQGVKDVYTVETTDGVQIRCGQDHLWSVYHAIHSTPTLVLRTTHELIERGVIKPCGRPRYTLPKFDGLQQGKSIDYAYALGYCLGNGGFSTGLLTVSYHSNIQDQIIPLLQSTLGLPTNSRINGGFSGQSTYSWSKIHPEIAKYRNSGLSQDKHLHKDHTDWLLWDYDSRLELLRGLLDSDGTVGKNGSNNSFCSTSINLLVLVRDLVRSLGGRACEPNQENRTHYKSGYCAELSFRMPVCPFKLKVDNWHISEYSMQSSVKSITIDDYQEDQVCIKVDAIDSLYVTTGFKLTHNTEYVKERFQEPEDTIFDDPFLHYQSPEEFKDITNTYTIDDCFNQSLTVGINDPILCNTKIRHQLIGWLVEKYDAEIILWFFQNDLEQCIKNSDPNKPVIQYIKHLSKNYHIPPNHEIIPVYNGLRTV